MHFELGTFKNRPFRQSGFPIIIFFRLSTETLLRPTSSGGWCVVSTVGSLKLDRELLQGYVIKPLT